MDAAFETYASLIPAMQAHFAARFPKSAQDSDAVHRAAIRAKALDTLRGMLPAATQSNVGIYGTGQAYEALLLRLQAHPLEEARECGAPDARGAAQDHSGVSDPCRPAGARRQVERVPRRVPRRDQRAPWPRCSPA